MGKLVPLMSATALGLLAAFLLGPFALQAHADLRFIAPSVDLHEARSGMPLSHKFPFVNDGADIVEIAELRPGCGCLVPVLEKRVYRAGESGTLLLEINTLAQTAGPHTWTVQVHYRQGDRLLETSLRMKAAVIHEITVQPAALIVFADRALEEDILLTDTRTHPLTVTRLESTSPYITAKAMPENRADDGSRVAKIHVAISAELPAGRHEEALHIYTNDIAYRDLKVMVTIVKKPQQRIQAFPGGLTWAHVGASPLPSQIVRIRDSSGEAIVIDRIVPDDPTISCRWAPGPGAMATVKIGVEGLKLGHGPTFRSAIHVHVSKPVKEVLTIPLIVSGE